MQGMRSETAVRRESGSSRDRTSQRGKRLRSSTGVQWAWLDLNQRPHPYQVSRAKRCADRRFPRSLRSVRGQGMRSNSSARISAQTQCRGRRQGTPSTIADKAMGLPGGRGSAIGRGAWLGVDPQALAVDVAPHDRGLRVALGHDRGGGGDGWALDQVSVGRRDLVGHLIAAQADGWHRLHLPTVRASAAGTRSGRHRVGADEVSDGLHDLGGLLQVRTVTSALDDPEARIGDPGRQLELMLRREHEVVTPGHH